MLISLITFTWIAHSYNTFEGKFKWKAWLRRNLLHGLLFNRNIFYCWCKKNHRTCLFTWHASLTATHNQPMLLIIAVYWRRQCCAHSVAACLLLHCSCNILYAAICCHCRSQHFNKLISICIPQVSECHLSDPRLRSHGMSTSSN